MTKAELETRLKMSDEALTYAFKRYRQIRAHMQDMNFGTAEKACRDAIEKLDEILDANAELLNG